MGHNEMLLGEALRGHDDDLAKATTGVALNSQDFLDLWPRSDNSEVFLDYCQYVLDRTSESGNTVRPVRIECAVLQ